MAYLQLGGMQLLRIVSETIYRLILTSDVPDSATSKTLAQREVADFTVDACLPWGWPSKRK